MKELAKELRIGNLLQGDPIQNVNQGIYSDGVFAITGYGISELELGRMFKAEPIPLTEEWVLKLGINLSDWFCEGSYKIVKDGDCGWCMRVRNASYTKEIEFSYFKFVHQLQNLFYCLCGEELTITEESKNGK